MKYLTTAELAARLRKSPRTIEGWRQVGYGPQYIRAGKDCRYSLASIERWEAAQTGKPLKRRLAA